MPKKAYSWEQFLILIFTQSQTPNWSTLALSPRQISQIVSKGLIAIALISLWWWNGQLLLATAVGISLMWIVYKISSRQSRKLWQNMIQLVSGYNRKLLFAVGSGSLGGLITYLTAAIWAETENHWLAVGSILQGFGTLITLILLGWQINRQSSYQQTIKFEQFLEDLTATESLKRFIAIRQLTNLISQQSSDRCQRRQVIEYFQFMLAQPQEESIQEALFDSLDILGIVPLSLNQSPTLQSSIPVKQSVREIS